MIYGMARFKDNLSKVIEVLPRPLRWPVALCAVIIAIGSGGALAGWLVKIGHPGLAGLAFFAWLVWFIVVMGP